MPRETKYCVWRPVSTMIERASRGRFINVRNNEAHVMKSFALALIVVPISRVLAHSLIEQATSAAGAPIALASVLLLAIVLTYAVRRTRQINPQESSDSNSVDKASESLDNDGRIDQSFEALQEIIPVGIFRSNAKGQLLSANQALVEMLDYGSVDEILSVPMTSFYKHPEQREKLLGRLITERRAVKLEINALRKSGGEIWVRGYIKPIFNESGELSCMEGIIEDITEFRLADLRHRESEQRYHLLTDMSPTGIYLTDPNGDIIYANEQWANLSGISTDAAMGRGWEKAIHPDDIERVKSSWYGAVTRKQNWEGEYRYLQPNGKVVWAWGQSRPLLDENRELIGYIGSNTEITRIKEAETATSYSEAKYRAVVQSAALGIASLDDRGFILSINPALAEITGFNEQSMLKRNLKSFLREEDHEIFNSTFIDQINGTANSRSQLAVRLQRRDGDTRTLNVSFSRLSENSTGNQEQIIAVIEDITERLLLEEEISHAAKLESVGLLAGGIAHDFNNILTGIIGNLSLAEMSAEEGSELHELIMEAEQSAQRAQKLTKRLVTFSQGGTPVTKTMPIDEVVRDAAAFAVQGSDVKCEIVVEPDLDYVNIDEGQFVQVIHNLVMNADQAMPRGGDIKIEMSNFQTAEGADPKLQPGRYVKIDIVDEGIGIPIDYLPKIFDPFFSTKDTGSGLGLSTSYSIVRKHNGQIKVSSSVGRGSRFSIFLPAAESPSQFAGEKRQIKESNHGQILIMDDEQTVRDVTRLSLQKLGFEVVEATNCEEAVERYRQIIGSGGSLELVLLDLTIPGGRDGRATLNELRSIDSDVRAIVMSGYSNDPVMSDYRNFGFCGVISKPFGFKELSEAISLALTGKTESSKA